MRTIAEISHSACKITVFSWNSKYLIKLEKDMLEQTYKVSEWEVSGADDLRKLLDEAFMGQVLKRFEEMEVSFHQALDRL